MVVDGSWSIDIEELLKNAPFPITDRVGGKATLVNVLIEAKAQSPIVVSREHCDRSIRCSEVPWNARLPMALTDCGIDIDVRAEHPLKASSEMDFKDSGRVICDRFVH